MRFDTDTPQHPRDALLKNLLQGKESTIDTLSPDDLERLATHGDGQGRTLLMAMALHGAVEAIEKVLPVSDPAAQDMSGMTALHYACMGRSAKAVTVLMTPATVGVPDVNGMTPLMLAAYLGDPALVTILAPRSDPAISNAADSRGRTALMHAVSHPMHGRADGLEAVRLLLAQADPMRRDAWGRTALDHALNAEQWAVLPLFARAMPAGEVSAALERMTVPHLKQRALDALNQEATDLQALMAVPENPDAVPPRPAQPR